MIVARNQLGEWKSGWSAIRTAFRIAGVTVIVERAIGVPEYRRLRAEVGWCSPDDRVCAAALAASLFTVVAHDEEGRSVGMARAVGDGLYVLIVDVVVTRCVFAAVGSVSRMPGPRRGRSAVPATRVRHADVGSAGTLSRSQCAPPVITRMCVTAATATTPNARSAVRRHRSVRTGLSERSVSGAIATGPTILRRAAAAAMSVCWSAPTLPAPSARAVLAQARAIPADSAVMKATSMRKDDVADVSRWTMSAS